MTSRLDSGYYDESELASEGFYGIGRDVHVAKNCTVVGASRISMGNHVRIDGYCTLIAPEGGSITIGSYVHIAAYSLLAGGDGIVLEDFAGLSQGVRIYTRSDDYSGEYLTNPTVPAQYTNLTTGRVTLRRHVIVGSGTVILPKVTIGVGTSVGALSLVTRDLEEWGVYAGCPVRRLKDRSRRLLDLEKKLLSET